MIANRIGNIVHGANSNLSNVKLLMVGVGGIGCEILKNIVKLNLGQTHILDMDTIELSNLNRQFLFKQQHKGKSKALTARQSILNLNPHAHIVAHHMDIRSLPISFFKQFTLIILALDNVDARNYVNKIAVRLNIFIIDAGTLAYKGNVTPIVPSQSYCYSCQPKNNNQKSFPVCTIRMRPQKPIHCITWAKMVFQTFFGTQVQQNQMKDLCDISQTQINNIVSKLFHHQILDIKNAKSDTTNQLSQMYANKINPLPLQTIEQNIKKGGIKGYKGYNSVQSTQNNIGLLAQSFERLKQAKQKQGSIVFQKDDDDIIHFISSAANLRMGCFSIQQQSFNQIKNMAGNIVPAIASTNSIVAGLEIIQLLKFVKGQKNILKNYFVQNQHNKIYALSLQKPLASCKICNQNIQPVIVQCNFKLLTLKLLVDIIKKQGKLQQFSINHGSKQIFNSQQPRETMLIKTMHQINASSEFDLILTDEQTSKSICTIWLVDNSNLTQPQISRIQKLIPAQQENIIQPQNKKIQQQDDDDLVVFDDAQGPQLQIIAVKKRQRTEVAQDGIQLKKRTKFE